MTTSHFRFPLALQRAGTGTGKSIRKLAPGAIGERAHAHDPSAGCLSPRWRLEPVDVEPGEVACDAEGRLLRVVVRGEVRRTGPFIDQSGARVELVLVEDQPEHAEDLRRVLLDWLGLAEPGVDLSTANLAALVERARSWKAR